MLSSSPMRTPKLQLTAEQSTTGECWILSKKDTPRPRAKMKPQKDCRMGDLESNPISASDAHKAQTKPYAHQETPQR